MAEGQSSTLSKLPSHIPASYLKEITNNFSDERKLGGGAFGTVYMGILKDGGVMAVKKLEENAPVPQEKSFMNEVGSLMAIHHENIVKLVGFCHETQKRLVEHNGKFVIVDVAEVFLCYEYVPKGSLEKYIFGPNGIDWDTRFKIIEGICKGLNFLHEEMDAPIVHMDLKPDNILLDDNMAPKIADFGLSRLFGQEKTRMYTQKPVGAWGYMAPEFLYRGEISTQSDIYSLGLLIIQICTGEKNVQKAEDMCGTKFIANVQQKWTDSYITSMFTSVGSGRLKQIRMCIQIGLQCVHPERKSRPSITEILERLNA